MIPQPWYRKDRKTWCVQISGRQINLGKTRKEADAKYKRLLQQYGLRDGPSRTRIAELVDEYWGWYEREKSTSSIESRRDLMRTFRDQTPNLLAEEIRPLHVDKWISRSNAKAASTSSDRITLISGMFNWGKRMRLVKVNPIKDMPRPTPEPREDYVPPNKFAELIRSCKSPEARDLVVFMLDTGCRVQEISKLEAQYFDGVKFVLPISKSKGKRRQRVVYVPESSQPMVRRLCRKWKTGPVFRNSTGSPWNKNSINRLMKRLRPRVGIDNLCATMLRHSFAHHRLSQGQSPEIVAKLLGHVDTSMLMKLYGHLADAVDLLTNEASRVKLLVENGSGESDGPEGGGARQEL